MFSKEFKDLAVDPKYEDLLRSYIIFPSLLIKLPSYEIIQLILISSYSSPPGLIDPEIWPNLM